MGHALAQIIIPFSTLIPEDVSVNTFHFSGSDTVSDAAPTIKARLKDFYDLAPASTVPLKNFYAGNCVFSSARIKVYDMDAPEPRVPVIDEGLGASNATPSGSKNLPSEVAICASFRAAAASGSPAARRRGRVYLGPLADGCVTTGTTAPARPNTSALTTVAQVCDRLAEASTANVLWTVYSRVDNQWRNVVAGWVDDAFDTQRRRGQSAVSRTTWSA